LLVRFLDGAQAGARSVLVQLDRPGLVGDRREIGS
jgi:hypothetical protein